MSTEHERECGPALTPRERERIDATLLSIPEDAQTGLEIGWSDGRMTLPLAERLNLVSIDLQHRVEPWLSDARLVFANAAALPFGDRQFDIVICTEVLEHLPDASLRLAVAEMTRVAGRYVLVSTPYRQRVWNELYRCTQCNFVGNTMEHLRQMDDADLRELFSEWHPLGRQLLGEAHGYAPDWLYRWSRRFGNVWEPCNGDLCTRCGKPSGMQQPNMLGWFMQRLIWRWERARGSRTAWVLMIFRR